MFPFNKPSLTGKEIQYIKKAVKSGKISGEGGMLVIYNKKFNERAEIIWGKGINRSAFAKEEVKKYNWVDIGSSFLPSEITSAFLFAQLHKLDIIRKKKLKFWNLYYQELKDMEGPSLIKLPEIPNYATNNAHMFFILCQNLTIRNLLIEHLKRSDILSVFHYLPLYLSPYYIENHNNRKLEMVEYYSDCLLRLPLYVELRQKQVMKIIKEIKDFYFNKK